MDGQTIAILTWAWLFGLITSVIASRKDLPGFKWFLLGALLGPIGVLIVVFQSGLPACPACGSRMKSKTATICAACGRPLYG